jgi:hypothetical protein
MLSKSSPRLLLEICLTVLVAFVIISLSSCSDEEADPKDSTAPVISFSNLNANGIVWNTVEAELNVTDDTGIKTVEVYVDGNLVSTISGAPYEFNWDSNTVPDGNHIIKVVATDDGGNKAETQVAIIVKNTLITINVPENQVTDTEDYTLRQFVVLSDESGNVITYAEVQNGEKIEMKSSSFEGEDFYLSEVRYIHDAWNDSWRQGDVLTFPGVDRGNWVLYTQGLYTENTTQAIVNFQNAESGKSYMTSTNYDNRLAEPETAGFSQTLGLIASPSRLFIQKRESGTPTSYRLIPSIKTGSNPAVDLSQGWLPLSSVTGSVPVGLSDVYSTLWGYPNPQDDDERYFVGEGQYNEEENKMVVYRPGEGFPRYEHTYEFSKDNYFVIKSSESLEMSFTPIVHTLDIDMTNNGFNFDVTGESELSFVSFNNIGFNTQWTFAIPINANGTIVAPKMPQEVKEFLDIPVFNFQGVQSYELFEYGAFDSYDELIDAFRDGVEWVDLDNKDYTLMQIYLDNGEGGRKAAKSFTRKSISDRLKRLRKN